MCMICFSKMVSSFGGRLACFRVFATVVLLQALTLNPVSKAVAVAAVHREDEQPAPAPVAPPFAKSPPVSLVSREDQVFRSRQAYEAQQGRHCPEGRKRHPLDLRPASARYKPTSSGGSSFLASTSASPVSSGEYTSDASVCNYQSAQLQVLSLAAEVLVTMDNVDLCRTTVRDVQERLDARRGACAAEQRMRAMKEPKAARQVSAAQQICQQAGCRSRSPAPRGRGSTLEETMASLALSRTAEVSPRPAREELPVVDDGDCTTGFHAASATNTIAGEWSLTSTLAPGRILGPATATLHEAIFPDGTTTSGAPVRAGDKSDFGAADAKTEPVVRATKPMQLFAVYSAEAVTSFKKCFVEIEEEVEVEDGPESDDSSGFQPSTASRWRRPTPQEPLEPSTAAGCSAPSAPPDAAPDPPASVAQRTTRTRKVAVRSPNLLRSQSREILLALARMRFQKGPDQGPNHEKWGWDLTKTMSPLTGNEKRTLMEAAASVFEVCVPGSPHPLHQRPCNFSDPQKPRKNSHFSTRTQSTALAASSSSRDSSQEHGAPGSPQGPWSPGSPWTEPDEEDDDLRIVPQEHVQRQVDEFVDGFFRFLHTAQYLLNLNPGLGNKKVQLVREALGGVYTRFGSASQKPEAWRERTAALLHSSKTPLFTLEAILDTFFGTDASTPNPCPSRCPGTRQERYVGREGATQTPEWARIREKLVNYPQGFLVLEFRVTRMLTPNMMAATAAITHESMRTNGGRSTRDSGTCAGASVAGGAAPSGGDVHRGGSSVFRFGAGSASGLNFDLQQTTTDAKTTPLVRKESPRRSYLPQLVSTVIAPVHVRLEYFDWGTARQVDPVGFSPHRDAACLTQRPSLRVEFWEIVEEGQDGRPRYVWDLQEAEIHEEYLKKTFCGFHFS